MIILRVLRKGSLGCDGLTAREYFILPLIGSMFGKPKEQESEYRGEIKSYSVGPKSTAKQATFGPYYIWYRQSVFCQPAEDRPGFSLKPWTATILGIGRQRVAVILVPKPAGWRSLTRS